ncbi:MAG TPA: class I SAM-dependent methyltransferase [Solirubrobacterales bacterium]|nr:class I SAM-dependent methyltransferase [Solirubrobacterales bacterium]HMX70347.1 class I SAM-dependent methyltransferase [Solirubrobacterales bacterium]HMY24761.1 class I SAM-dependent methyltransferase [Solirubrobacterales bacterium]HNA23728.1 class I SAM-dependent methyltransferase [Solirubrobacterales bacterium]HNE76926.1 class I SAM-dependent methyltransferase [Solirubrobacterales bacterium]
MSNWDKGSYEVTAEQIAPATPAVADAVEPVTGKLALDLACGTGNEALELARRGARVTGYDGAPRLLQVAGERAAAEGLELERVQGDLAELPFDDDSFEIVTSVFGLIFTGSPQDSAAEIGRVLRPQGRIAFTSWVEEGLFQYMQDMAKAAVASHFGQAPPEGADAPFAWGDEVAVRELFSESGLMLQVETRELVIEEESAAALNDRWFDLHPIWITMQEVIGDEAYEEMRREALPVVESHNEASDGSFRNTLRYLLFEGSPV